MKTRSILSLCFLFSLPLLAAATPPEGLDADTKKLIQEITGPRGQAFSNLQELTKLGHRLSGTSHAEKAVEWAKKKMESYGFDKVTLQPVKVTHWERGDKERAAIAGKKRLDLKITALGTSAATNGVLSANVIEVHGLDEVRKLGEAVRGKIVFYNRPMNPDLPNTFAAYGQAGDQRFDGPDVASQNGAVATLVRSLTTLKDDDHPHTGVTSFDKGKPIPAAALSTHAANVLAKALKANPNLKVELELNCQNFPKALSHNVIGEIRGAAHPDEIVVVGGHLDSWDLATGAHDDGAGVVQSIEAVRAIKALGHRPARTIRAVLFMAEEVGGEGGHEYANQAKAHDEHHVGALESDSGGFAPVGFDVDGDQAALDEVKSWLPYLQQAGARTVEAGGSGTDVEPLDALGVATFGFDPVPTHYFDVHHSALDTIDAVNPKELKQSAAAMAVFTYLVSEKGIPPVKGARLHERRRR